MKQSRPFRVVISNGTKATLKANADRFGVPYGIFFDTSGKVRIERINPTAHYSYIWRTDKQ